MRGISKVLSMTSACAVLVCIATPSYALFADDDARKAILELREKITVAQNAQLQLAGQIDSLREQNAALTGRIEQLANNLSLQQRSARDLFNNLDKRVAAFESRIDTVDGRQFTVSAEEKRRYDLSLALFSAGNYAASMDLLGGLVSDFPKTGYMPSALYWLGNARFAQGDLKGAIEAQDRLIAEFDQDSRIPEAMLSKAAAQASDGDKAEAVETLKLLLSKYPDSESAGPAAERLKSLEPAPTATKKRRTKN